METFDNNVIKGIHKSRYVASWTNSGGKLDRNGKGLFKNWLKGLSIEGEHLSDEEVQDIYNYSTNGKLELEVLAKGYLAEAYKARSKQ